MICPVTAAASWRRFLAEGLTELFQKKTQKTGVFLSQL